MTRGTIEMLRTFLLNQKSEEVVIKFEDISGASTSLTTKLSTTIHERFSNKSLGRRMQTTARTTKVFCRIAKKKNKQSASIMILSITPLSNSSLSVAPTSQPKSLTVAAIERSEQEQWQKLAKYLSPAWTWTALHSAENVVSVVEKTRLCRSRSRLELMSQEILTTFALEFPLAASRFPSNKEFISS